jgi:hypothetical protein
MFLARKRFCAAPRPCSHQSSSRSHKGQVDITSFCITGTPRRAVRSHPDAGKCNLSDRARRGGDLLLVQVEIVKIEALRYVGDRVQDFMVGGYFFIGGHTRCTPTNRFYTLEVRMFLRL